MDIHIYDMEVAPESVIMVCGPTKPESSERLAKTLQAVSEAIPGHPVIYVPDSVTIDALKDEEAAGILNDALFYDRLVRLRGIVDKAIETNKEVPEDG